MIHENPEMRPSTSTLSHHPWICPESAKSKAQLTRELKHEKFEKEKIIQREQREKAEKEMLKRENELLHRKVNMYEQQMSSCNWLNSPLVSTTTTTKSIDTTGSGGRPNKFARSHSSTFI